MSLVIKLFKIFSEYNFVRLPSDFIRLRLIKFLRLCSITFDYVLFSYVRLSSIINVFDYVQLPTPGFAVIHLPCDCIPTILSVLLKLNHMPSEYLTLVSL